MAQIRLYLIPARGLRVINPETRRPLPPEGEEVARDAYWQRRIDDGDVAEGAPPKAKTTKPTTQETEK
ncbi:DUF2635 domain-containing protein [Pseudoxanthomonas sp. 22568]|uniref:DUF2635 domain-containing protein n=1 Tax=Pseudoxanthomonas sp. 22568 TaxID=3453945 RepID=UPI003F8344FC